MFSWLSNQGNKIDHPMSSMVEAKKLLAELPKDNALEALQEITSWLLSVTDTPGFHAELRTSIIMLLDETGQPFHAELLKRYLAAPHLQDFQGMHLWQQIHGFAKELARAYGECIASYRQEEAKPYELQEKLPLLCTRLLRAISEQIKLELMRYIDVGEAAWERMFRCYSLAETSQF